MITKNKEKTKQNKQTNKHTSQQCQTRQVFFELYQVQSCP